MSFQYPDKPWVDGQTVRREMDDGTVLIGQYDLSKNLWSFSRSTEGATSGIVTTADVYTLNERPDTGTNPFNLTDEPDTVVNQQEANWWLFEDLDKRARKPIIQDTAPTIHPLYSTDERFLIKGDMWVDITADTLYWWDGSNWQEFTGGRTPIFSDTEPLVHPDFLPPNDALISGDIWYDTTDLEQLIEYVYDGTQWILTGNYVKKKGGDSMEGPLIITGPRNADPAADNPALVSSLEVLSIDNTQDMSLRLRHSGNTKVYIGENDISIASDITFNRTGSSVVKSNVQDLLNIGEREIAYLGESIEDEDLITKKYVDDATDFLQNEIIELEEEIEAIAPSVERGSWGFTDSGVVSGPGVFTAYDQYVITSGSPEGLVTNIKSLWFHSIDNDETPHGFDNIKPGNLLQLFVEGSEEYGLFEVVEVHDFTGDTDNYWVIDVDFVRTLEPTTSFDNSETCRLKIFQAPEGGTADGFVMKTGDTMSGALIIDKTAGGSIPADGTEASLGLIGSRPDTTKSAATIKFENKQTTEPGFLTYRSGSGGNWFAFTQDVDLNNKGLHTVGQIRLKPGGYIGSGNKQRIKIRDGGEGSNLAGTEIQRPGDGLRTFAIRGKPANSSTEGDFFWAFGNATGGDAINYTGRITAENHITNKAYVDDRVRVDISSSSSNRVTGDMWYNPNDQVLYLKVS